MVFGMNEREQLYLQVKSQLKNKKYKMDVWKRE